MSEDPRTPRLVAVKLAFDAVARVSFTAGAIVLVAAFLATLMALWGSPSWLAGYGLVVALALALGGLMLLLAAVGAQSKARDYARAVDAAGEDA